MKFRIFMIFWIPSLLNFMGCVPSDFVREQEKITVELSRTIEATLQKTEGVVEKFSERIIQSMNNLKHCKNTQEKGEYSSMYYPKSAVVNQRTFCFVQATKLSEKDWYNFFQESGYISWIYAFDEESKVKRITPAAKVKFLFGPDLLFNPFSFYKDAVAQYPKVTWTAIKEDINGTGRIIIATQAFKLPKSKSFTTLSIDVNLKRLFKDKFIKLQEFTQRKELQHIFSYVYAKEEKGRAFVANFTNDLSLWNLLRPQDRRLLNLPPKEEAELEKLEEEVASKRIDIGSKVLQLRERKYLCTLTRATNIALFTLICTSK